MTSIVQTPAAPEVPRYPALGSANFNQEAYAYGSSMPGVSFRIWEIGSVAEQNARLTKGFAEDSAQSASAADGFAQSASGSATAAARSEAAALAYAQAAGASAGIPEPVPGKKVLGIEGMQAAWVEVPEDESKLDKAGGVATALGYSYNDLGTIAAAGTAAVNVQTAAVQRIHAAGNLTLTFEGWATDGRSEDLELHCANFGGKTVVWPAGYWMKSDGTLVPAVGNSGVTWQTAGVDRVLVMRDLVHNGGVYQIVYKVMR